MWKVVRISHGSTWSLPGLPPFEKKEEAVDFINRFGESNPLAPTLRLELRKIPEIEFENAN